MKKLHFVRYGKLMADIRAMMPRVPRDYDLVLGIPRTGMIVATAVAEHMHKYVLSTDAFLEGVEPKAGNRMKSPPSKRPLKILVCDDTVGNGIGMTEVRERLKEAEFSGRVDTLAVYVAPQKEKVVDFYRQVVPFPRLFEWNWIGHILLKSAGVDIDGVLTEDPKPGVDDDGPRYIRYLREARPWYVPKVAPAALVTCRLEKYRKETEAWLKKHGAKYGKLVMMQYKTRAARIKDGKHAEWKASVMKRLKLEWFVESNPLQAKRIARAIGRPVLCIGDMKVY